MSFYQIKFPHELKKKRPGAQMMSGDPPLERQQKKRWFTTSYLTSKKEVFADEFHSNFLFHLSLLKAFGKSFAPPKVRRHSWHLRDITTQLLNSKMLKKKYLLVAFFGLTIITGSDWPKSIYSQPEEVVAASFQTNLKRLNGQLTSMAFSRYANWLCNLFFFGQSIKDLHTHAPIFFK